MSVSGLAESAERRFRERYGRAPRWLAAAPGRVNLIGEHTDYNDGFVFPMAIDRCTVIAAGPSDDAHQIRLWSEAEESPAVIDLRGAIGPGEPRWANYCRGVVAGFQRLGAAPPGLDVSIVSEVPPGGGLSSSAALEVGFATILECATGRTLDLVAKAALCQRAEQEFAGVPCGIMDQFIVTMGREDNFLLLDCRSHERQYVSLGDPGLAVLIINTNVRHELSEGGYAVRRSQCEAAAAALGVRSLREVTGARLEAGRGRLGAVEYRRARHVVSEIARTVQAAEKMRGRRWEPLGRLMYESHASLRDDYEVSCPELDLVVALAAELGPNGGVVGCRMTGGGFGGCAVALVRTDAVAAVSRFIEARYRSQTGIQPALFVTRPSGGARVLQPAGPAATR